MGAKNILLALVLFISTSVFGQWSIQQGDFLSPRSKNHREDKSIQVDDTLYVVGVSRLGTVYSGTWNGSVIGAIYGGTGQTTVTIGDLLYGSASNVWSKLAGVATGNALISGGVSTAPSWGKVGLATHVDGNLPVTNLNSGTNADASRYWRGDGTWATIAVSDSSLWELSSGIVIPKSNRDVTIPHILTVGDEVGRDTFEVYLNDSSHLHFQFVHQAGDTSLIEIENNQNGLGSKGVSIKYKVNDTTYSMANGRDAGGNPVIGMYVFDTSSLSNYIDINSSRIRLGVDNDSTNIIATDTALYIAVDDVTQFTVVSGGLVTARTGFQVGGENLAGFIRYREAMVNGSNQITVVAPANVTSNKIQTLQDATGTIALVEDLSWFMLNDSVWYVKHSDDTLYVGVSPDRGGIGVGSPGTGNLRVTFDRTKNTINAYADSMLIVNIDEDEYIMFQMGVNNANFVTTLDTFDFNKPIVSTNIYSSTYTPTLTNTTNVAASTAYVTGYYRIGTSVTVYGKIDIDATLAASAATELGISLPIASDLTGEEDLGGNAISDAIASLTARIKGDAANNRASVVFKALSLTNDSYSFEFSYQIK